ncbi:MAG: carbamoyl phosphate synthase large subunit [Firmicutes bacterium ML8_F2]|nr:MAG: carbamoyl phosphate synthase large subunit [Firmicutes bacterium ML8_F2]
MPRRNDLQKIMLIGSGPIVIGQACEFDYSGTQACRALKEEGYEVVLINSNPATIMTDPAMADRTYIEPLTVETAARIIEKERPDALLPTLGGQTALNIAVELADSGQLEKYGTELIGASADVIKKAENRELFKEAMSRIGLATAKSVHLRSMEEALAFADRHGYPLVIRPSFTLGGAGGGIAYNEEHLVEMVEAGLGSSPIKQVLVEEALTGWKEFELELMRDHNDNVVVICSIENIDPMGIHTGESLTVAPAQTLSDLEYQVMRSASIAAMREIGVETGGCNIQFAVEPESGRLVVVEMNPRVSRSSALASKATGFPIAKIAARLAVGYTLDELTNDITRETPASFEPAIDYCVVKIPRWDFAKFPGADQTLTTRMKSVGEVMSIGRTFKEALQKALRSLEQGYDGLMNVNDREETDSSLFSLEQLKEILPLPRAARIFTIAEALRKGLSADEVSCLTGIDGWFIDQIFHLVEFEDKLRRAGELDEELLWQAKSRGFSDSRIAFLRGTEEKVIRELRHKYSIYPVFRRVDTCAGEFEAYTPYLYSTYERGAEEEAVPLNGTEENRGKVIILGGGPNRIGQGLEFDYCCVQAALTLREEGYRVIMVNCNPETVSTDYDISDCLYFEPLTLEDVLNICHEDNPDGLILQFGGQTPLKLALPLLEEGIPIWGTSPQDIDRAENRREFALVVDKLDLWEPAYGIATRPQEARKIAEKLGFPILVRPSYVLGGLAMRLVYTLEELDIYLQSGPPISSANPLLIDKYLEGAVELDVDALSDGEKVVIGGVMEHVEQAGVHSGDSCCVLPPYSIGTQQLKEIHRQTEQLARELNIRGLLNIQFAVRGREVYILEANPRASRTVPFTGKATGVPLAGLAARVIAGASLSDLGFTFGMIPNYYSVKEAVFSFSRFDNADIVLGPEMRSTGEVMGIDSNLGLAMAKALLAAGTPLPVKGTIFITVADRDKPQAVEMARSLWRLGYNLLATRGTAAALRDAAVAVEEVKRIGEGSPHMLDYINEGKVDLIINTPAGSGAFSDGKCMRQQAVQRGVSLITTMQGAMAALDGMRALQQSGMDVQCLQEYYSC